VSTATKCHCAGTTITRVKGTKC